MNSLLVAVGLVPLWVGPMFALIGIFALARRWFHSSKRRNPLATGLLRGPGHTLREPLDDARLDMMAYLSVGSSMPLFVWSRSTSHLVRLALQLPSIGGFRLWPVSAFLRS